MSSVDQTDLAPQASGDGGTRSAARTADGAAAGGALGTSRFVSPTLSKAQKWDRRERYARRSQSSRWLISDAIQADLPDDVEEVEQGVFVNATTGELHEADWVRPPRPARCSWRIGENVAVHGEAGHAHFSGAERCGSIWACPVCASVIRPERAAEITQAVEAHQEQGGSVVFLTLTLRHQRTDELGTTLDAALDGWRALMRGRWWAGGRDRPGIRDHFAVEGYVRAVEITLGDHGWHPHVHALLFTGRSLSDLEIDALGDAFHGRWAAIAQQRTGRTPDRAHGVDVQRVDEDGRVLAQYLGKIQEKESRWTVSAEMARSDVKAGRGESLAPFQLLDDRTEKPAPQRRRLWAEYVTATKGRRAITWSRGLKARYSIGEKTDDEIMDETEAAPARWLVTRTAYDAARRTDGALILTLALEAAERDDWTAVAQLLPGHLPPDPD